MSSEIRRKFGLDYLIKDRPGEASQSTQNKEVELALLTVGSKIIDQLKNKQSHSARLHDLVETTGFELETLLPVVNRLQSLNVVRIADRDKFGNHEIALTPTGMTASL